MTTKVIGTYESISRFFNATQFFQTRIGLHWLIDSNRKITDSCYEITIGENVRYSNITVQAIAIAAGCHIEFKYPD